MYFNAKGVVLVIFTFNLCTISV